MKLQLKKFDMSRISADRVVVFIGKRNTGKSFLVRDLLYHHRDLPVGTVISATERANGFYHEMVPSIFIQDEFTPDSVSKVRKRQELVQMTMAQERERTGSTDIDPRAFLILDDCLYDKTWATDKNMRFFFMNGRHISLFLLITMQYPLGVPPNLRTNIDFVFILRENVVSNRKRIYDNFAGMFPNFDVFSQVMNQCTQDYECLVVDNTSKSNRLEDCIFWYKAETRPDFKLCMPQFWDLAREHEKERNRLLAQQLAASPSAASGSHTGDEDAYEIMGDAMEYHPKHFQRKSAHRVRVMKN